jgi:hypothetical protein
MRFRHGDDLSQQGFLLLVQGKAAQPFPDVKVGNM